VVNVNGQASTVAADHGPVDMKVNHVEKLTETTADISNLKGEKAYTFANDPAVKLTKGMNQFASIDAGSHAAINQANSDANGSMLAVSQMGDASSTANRSTGIQAAGSSEAGIDQLSTVGGVEIFGADPGGHDALDVSFTLTSARPLPDPYLIIISRFKNPGDAGGAYRELVYAKALAPLEVSKPVDVKLEQAGFPPGFNLMNFEIHLYNAGVEIGTNVAPKHTTLTLDGAFEYVKRHYLAAHRTDTLPATPVLADLPSDLESRVAAGSYAAPIYVKVSKEGLALSPFSDSACSKPIDDAYLASVLKTIRFKPALDKGEPVEGVATLNLARVRG
jgi:hypothetical protein